MSRASRIALSAALLSLSAGFVIAQPLERVQNMQNGVSYVSGGIGSDEAASLRQAAADYPLTIELASAQGGPTEAYVSDARVDVLDADGNSVLSTTTAGPLLLVQLPTGRYNVGVVWHGTQKTRTVDVGADRRQHVMFEFPAEKAAP